MGFLVKLSKEMVSFNEKMVKFGTEEVIFMTIITYNFYC